MTSKSALNHLIEILKAQEVIEWNMFLAEQQCDALRAIIVQKLLLDHPIQSLIRPWFFEKVAQLIFLDQEKIYHKYYDKIKSQLVTQNSSTMFEAALSLKQNFKVTQEISGQKFKSANLFPQRIYYIRKENYMSTTVIKDPISKTYRIQNSTDYTVDTWKNFWRIRLFCTRLFVWTYNLATLSLHLAFRSQFGLFAILFCIPFYSTYRVDSDGNIYKSDYQDPVCTKFCQVLENISSHKRQFDKKNKVDDCCYCCCYLLFFLIEYIIRFLIEGVFITLIVLTVFVVFFSLICLFTFLLSPFLVLFFLLFRQMIVIFLVDLDHPFIDKSRDQNHPSLKLVNYECWPLIFAIVQFMLCGLTKLLFCVIFGLFLHPLFAGLILIYSLLQWLFTTIIDQFVFVMIICQGRQPGRDTFMATKVSGWGMGRKNYSTIDLRDLKFFVLARLEKIMLDEYEIRMSHLIYKPVEEAKQMVLTFFSHFRGQMIETDIVPQALIESCQQLKIKFSETLKIRRNQLSLMPNTNIRFTEKELKLNMNQTKIMIEKLVTSRKMTYIWKYTQTQEYDFEQLNKNIWIAVFGSEEVLEPIEETQKRFSLKKQFDRNHIQSIIKLIAKETKIVLQNPGYAAMPEQIIKKKNTLQ